MADQILTPLRTLIAEVRTRESVPQTFAERLEFSYQPPPPGLSPLAPPRFLAAPTGRHEVSERALDLGVGVAPPPGVEKVRVELVWGHAGRKDRTLVSSVDGEGKVSHSIELEPGENTFKFVATNEGAADGGPESRPLGPFERIRLSAGLSELQPEDDAKSLFERADEALYRAKEGGKGRFSAADGVS